MLIRLEEIKPEGTLVELEASCEAFPVLQEMTEQGECPITGPIQVRLKFQRLRNLVELSGELTFSVELDCSRCLESFCRTLQADFKLVCLPREEPADEDSQDEVELSQEDLGILGFDGETIRYRDALQEQVVLALPFRALCSADCRGLCPQCGASLNQGGCSCVPKTGSLKFAALKDFVVSK